MTPKDEVQVLKLKLKNQKEHLEALENKRTRLDYEILILKKKLKKDSKKSTKRIAEIYSDVQNSLKISENTIFIGSAFEELNSDLYSEIEQVDELLVEITEILRRTQ